MKTMRPLPFLPAAPILRAVSSEPDLISRLELWNLIPDGARTARRQLDHVVISLATGLTAEPSIMVTTRPSRTPDPELQQAVGTARLVPAARQSILTVPLDINVLGWPNGPDRMHVAEQLLAALAGDERPWTSIVVTVNGESHPFRILTWPSGALWVGAYRDVTVSAIGRGQLPDRLQLEVVNDEELAALTTTPRD